MSSGSSTEFRTISYRELEAQDAQAISTLYAAANEDGFFYLSLECELQFGILQDVSALALISTDVFDLSLEEKMCYDSDKLGTLRNYGYKPLGRNTGVAHGRKDGYELFHFPQDILFGVKESGRLQAPKVILESRRTLERFALSSHKICLTILELLSQSACIPDLVSKHRTDHHSTSTVAMLKYPNLQEENSVTGHIAHTDTGSLTLLFCTQDGLEVMHPSSGEWRPAIPRPGHAIVNIGDSLHHLSHRRFKSALHRVLVPQVDQSDARHSLIYFMRPEIDAIFTDENGKEWKSVDWHTRKFDAYQTENASQVQKILDGRVSNG